MVAESRMISLGSVITNESLRYKVPSPSLVKTDNFIVLFYACAYDFASAFVYAITYITCDIHTLKAALTPIPTANDIKNVNGSCAPACAVVNGC